MTSVIVFLLAATVFAMGYRFFAGYLELLLPVAPEAPGANAPRWVALGQLLPALAGAVTVAGTATAGVLGWIPGFLWVLVATLLAAGPLGLGMLWLAGRHPGLGLPGILDVYLGGLAGRAGLALAALLAVAVAAVAVVMLERAVVNHPAIVLALLAQAAIAPLFAQVLGERPLFAILITGAAVALLFAVVAMGALAPIAMTGTLALHAGDTALLTFDPTLLWIVLAMLYGWAALKRDAGRLSAPRSVLAGAAMATVLVAAVVALFLRHPEFAAPAFNPEPPLRALPWVFAMVSGGAVAGFYALLILSQGAQAGSGAARAVGYGGALGDGAIAVLAVIACGAGFATPEGWRAVYAAGAVPVFGDAQDVFVLALARLLAGAGAGFELAANFAAFAVAGIALSALEAMLGVQERLLDHALGTAGPSLRRRRLALLAVTGLAALGLARFSPGLDAWLVLGATSLCLAALALLAVCLAAGGDERPPPLLAVPALGLALAAVAVLAALAWRAWATGTPWLLAATGALALPFALAATGAGRRALGTLARKSA